jgi:NADPH:quinone reductase-like Zn-dependent oxidoreductase
MNIPKTMLAIVLREFETSMTLSELAVPTAAARQVVVCVEASGVNPLDIKIIEGKAGHAQFKLPGVPGIDLAGVVVAIGTGVTEFKPGDRVYGMTGGIGDLQGSLAEYAAVDADLLAIMPKNLSMREAAALPLIFITAWEGLVDRAHLGAGHKVLIHGGAGGVGHIAVQIARAFGADVYATGSAEQKAAIEGFGATAIDYKANTVDQYVAQYTDGIGFDVIYDTVGGATLDASFSAARKYHGHVVSCLGWGEHKLAPLSFRAATYSGVFTLLPMLTGNGRAHHGEILREATKLVDSGKIRVQLDPTHYTLESVTAAHQSLITGTAKGKIVIDIAK